MLQTFTILNRIRKIERKKERKRKDRRKKEIKQGRKWDKGMG